MLSSWRWQVAATPLLVVCLDFQSATAAATSGSDSGGSGGSRGGGKVATSDGLHAYWVSSHSLALTVPAIDVGSDSEANEGSTARDVQGGAAMGENSASLGHVETELKEPRVTIFAEDTTADPGESWWWLIAMPVPAGGTAGIKTGDNDVRSSSADGGARTTMDRVTWDLLVDAFTHKMTSEDLSLLDSGRAQTEIDDFGINDPKAQTIRVGKSTFFRSMPTHICVDETEPPKGSFLPYVMTPVPTGRCVVELGNLAAATTYRVVLFKVEDAANVPKEPMKPYMQTMLATDRESSLTTAVVWFVKMGGGVAMVLGLVLQVFMLREELASQMSSAATPYTYISPVEAGELAFGRQMSSVGPSGFHHSKLARSFPLIFMDLLLSLTMFLPLVGPFGLLMASRIVIGERLLKPARAFFQFGIRSVTFWRSVVNLIINIIIIPINMWWAQSFMLVHFSGMYTYIGVRYFENSSVSTMQRRGEVSSDLSGVELSAWIPAVAISTFLLAVEMQNHKIKQGLAILRLRAETHLKRSPRGAKLMAQICNMEGAVFFDSSDQPSLAPVPNDGVTVQILVVSLLFGILPHLWMCLRRGAPLWDPNSMQTTFIYAINTSGVCIRFLMAAERCKGNYRQNLEMLAMFQALSWKEDGSSDLFDPFDTRNDSVLAARELLKQSDIEPLNLENSEDAQLWWRLRELVLITIKDERIMKQVIVYVCISFAALSGAFSVVVLFSLQEATAITLVTAVMTPILFRFTYRVLLDARDINLMLGEHSLLLHSVVAKNASKPGRSLENQLQSERFLLQLATLVEKSQPAETVAAFAVTPERSSCVIVMFGLLVSFAIWNLGVGILRLYTA
eukprot:TRINITY_DN12692_c0_g2_i1.p1 TRINITY_DN12692_c0_g2~~TRINITY_DN12692_c0_g2_i1.p1  ORF type:complete len:864 (-),score=138.60 TRINITY_DN12692_c0_g2_i1:165-2711(-)